MKQTIFAVALLASLTGYSQTKFPQQEISINGFRNPSIGLEYRYRQISVHGGYYITNFSSGITTKFVKAGLTYWFLPTDNKQIPSSFYAGASYLRGLNLDYKNQTALGIETGFRWMAWKGLNLRIGGIAIFANGQKPRFNPTPGISYSITLK